MIIHVIIKITISSLVIGFKKSDFPLIRLPSCNRTVCYWIVCYWAVCDRTDQKANHIQRCSSKQPITFKVVIDHITVVCLVAWPLNESEAGVDLVLIETLQLFICKFLLISMRTAH